MVAWTDSRDASTQDPTAPRAMGKGAVQTVQVLPGLQGRTIGPGGSVPIWMGLSWHPTSATHAETRNRWPDSYSQAGWVGRRAGQRDAVKAELAKAVPGTRVG